MANDSQNIRFSKRCMGYDIAEHAELAMHSIQERVNKLNKKKRDKREFATAFLVFLYHLPEELIYSGGPISIVYTLALEERSTKEERDIFFAEVADAIKPYHHFDNCKVPPEEVYKELRKIL